MKVTLKVPVPHVSKAEEQTAHLFEVLDKLSDKFGPLNEVQLEWARE